jgi:hypothetical protein
MTEKVDAAEVILEKSEDLTMVIGPPEVPVINPEVACMDDFDVLRLLG